MKNFHSFGVAVSKYLPDKLLKLKCFFVLTLDTATIDLLVRKRD